jgi:general secretion pathway protein D
MWLVARAAAGQTGDAKKQYAELLKQARSAMMAGDLSKAEQLVAKAEGLGVKLSLIEARVNDSSEKFRKDLAKAKVAMESLGGTEGAVVDRMTDTAKAKAKAALERGRKALAEADIAGAISNWQKARAAGATFEPDEYSPESLARAIEQEGVDLSKLVQGTAKSPFALSPAEMPSDPNVDRMTADAKSPRELGEAFGDTSPAARVDRDPAVQRASGSSQKSLKAEAQKLLAQAKLLKDRGDLEGALALAQQADDMNLPDSAFGATERRPFEVVSAIRLAMSRQDPSVRRASATEEKNNVSPSLYDADSDLTQVKPVSADEPFQDDPVETSSVALKLIRDGEAALTAGDRETAIEKFTQAWRREGELDARTRQIVKDKLTYLRASTASKQGVQGASDTSIENVDAAKKVAYEKMVREVAAERMAAEKLANENPRAALAQLGKLRDRVDQADLDGPGKRHLLTIVDRSSHELQAYIDRFRHDLDLREANQKVENELEQDRAVKLATQQKIADLTDKFNQLMEEERYPEAQVISKQVGELAPGTSIATQLKWKADFAMSKFRGDQILAAKERNYNTAMTNVEESSTPFDDNDPIQFNLDRWQKVSAIRKKGDEERRLSDAEKAIEKALLEKIDANFENRPLSQVIDYVGSVTGVNVHMDEVALRGEAVTSDYPVTLKLNQPIALKSFLNLILSPLRLTYVVENDVLKITSEAGKGSTVYPKTYYVADLVMPIPNFNPSYNMGLPAALRDSLNTANFNRGLANAGGAVTVKSEDMVPQLAPTGLTAAAQSRSSQVMAQMASAEQLQSLSSLANSRPSAGMGGYGPGGAGGGVQADFDTLITLVQETISPDSWEEAGGPGRISPFPLNLSLIVSQTQEVHQQLADLLQQLRRLQDLQVTIEVRFITLNDNFFERVGIDFDFNVQTDTPYTRATTGATTNIPNFFGRGRPNETVSKTTVIGLQNTGGGDATPTADLNIPFTQNTFAAAVPQFGGFQPANAANFGFALLSDIEVFFLLQASSGDARTNVLQAPKVTLYNGQSAFVNDTAARPFITQIIPVVGDFAAAHQPVVTVLNEGTTLSVQAVVSPDRKYVRLTLVPMFSKVGDVETFTFAGSTTSNSGTVKVDPTDPKKTVTDGKTSTSTGTTVQLPTFISTSVSTTVSVPDGGTVLLGGIKRLSEGRNEFGIPMLQHIPYVSRLFRNTAIGRTTSSLMMMVTPRIIIQEEEEENLGLKAGSSS